MWEWLASLPQVVVTIVGGIVSGAIGFIAAYIRGKQERGWAKQDARYEAILARVQAARVHLAIILTEIERDQGIYFNRATAERVLSDIRRAVYGLGDERLKGAFESGFLALWELGTGSAHRASGDKAGPHVRGLLEHLGRIEEEEGI